MRELRDILREFAALRARGGSAILASVVRVEGSTYRRAGARSLLLEDGRTLGLISGGCLESDLIENAARVRATGERCLVHYDSSSAEDIIWGLGLGCAGVVDVLLERVDAAQPGPLDFLGSCLAQGRSGALATVLSVDAPDAPAPGTRWWLASGGEVAGPALTSPVGQLASGALAAALAGEPRAAGRHEIPGGACELAIEVLPRPTPGPLRDSPWISAGTSTCSTGDLLSRGPRRFPARGSSWRIPSSPPGRSRSTPTPSRSS